jgi:hypothetical protein
MAAADLAVASVAAGPKDGRAPSVWAGMLSQSAGSGSRSRIIAGQGYVLSLTALLIFTTLGT